MTTKRICFINQKGGCGKSSSCFHLGGYFASLGMRVLLIDADPQASLSQGFFGSTHVENLCEEETLAALFDDESIADLPSLLAPTAFPNLTIVRSNQTLARHNIPAPEHSGLKQFAFQSLLENLTGFDLIVIDCPPNLYQCSWNALIAVDFVVIPVPPEDFATQGLRTIHQAIDHASRLNTRLELLGHLVTRADRRLLVHRAYEQKLRALYESAVLTTVIPEASAFKVSLSCRQPVTFYSQTCQASRSIADLGNELLARMDFAIDQLGVA